MSAEDKRYVIQIMWHINNECNLRCGHCYAQDQGVTPIDRWELQQLAIQRIVELSEYYRIIRVGLLGGEPLFDPNILQIIRQLRANGIERVDISTNGTLINAGLADELAQAGVTMVQISLEGPTATSNDAIRGKGSFVKALNGFRYLRYNQIQPGIMMTVSQANLTLVEPMAVLAHQIGAKIVAFNRMLPLGNGKAGNLTCLSPTELRQMIGLVHQLNERYPNMDVSSDDPLLHVPLDPNAPPTGRYGGCGAGIGNLTITHDGTIYPCRRLPIPIGRIQESPLIEVVNSSQLDCLYNRREYLKGKCRTCPHIESCGGCRAAANAFTGDFLNEDPQCWLHR